MGRKNTAQKIALAFGGLAFIGGFLGLLYPFAGNLLHAFKHQKVVREYQMEVEQASPARVEEMLARADYYNVRLRADSDCVTSLTDEQKKDYEKSLLLSESTGIMAYLMIPKIDVALPIYHGTEEAVLQVGVGHLEGSSLPVGGVGTHAVLTGHSGLPSSRLFTDLDRLKEGDLFTISVLDRELTYQVDSVRVEFPQDVELKIEDDEDRVTMITCTPVGVNTHRLLVSGVRVKTASQPGEEPETGEAEETKLSAVSMNILFDLAAIGVLLIVCAIVIVLLHRRKRRRQN